MLTRTSPGIAASKASAPSLLVQIAGLPPYHHRETAHTLTPTFEIFKHSNKHGEKKACTSLHATRPSRFFAGSEHTIRLEQNTAQPHATVSLARPHLPSGLCQLTVRQKKGAPQTFIPPGPGGRGKLSKCCAARRSGTRLEHTYSC